MVDKECTSFVVGYLFLAEVLSLYNYDIDQQGINLNSDDTIQNVLTLYRTPRPHNHMMGIKSMNSDNLMDVS